MKVQLWGLRSKCAINERLSFFLAMPTTCGSSWAKDQISNNAKSLTERPPGNSQKVQSLPHATSATKTNKKFKEINCVLKLECQAEYHCLCLIFSARLDVP